MKSLLLLAAAARLAFGGSAVAESGMKFAVEPPPSADIIQTTYCGQATNPVGMTAPLHFPGRCYVKQDGPESGKLSHKYSCNAGQVVASLYQTGDCSGDSADAQMQGCQTYYSYKCIAAAANTTYISLFDSCAGTGVAGTFAADGTCQVVSVRGLGQLAYEKSCETIRWSLFGVDSTCQAKVGHWTGKSGGCESFVKGTGSTPNCHVKSEASDTKGLKCNSVLTAAFAVAWLIFDM